jgi:signal transduction histidine kinase
MQDEDKERRQLKQVLREFRQEIAALKAAEAEGKLAEKALRKSEEAAQRLAEENAVIAKIGQIISSTINIEEVYERFAGEVSKLISFDRIVVNLYNPEKGTVTVTHASGLDVEGRREGDEFPLKGSALEIILETRRGLINHPESLEELEDRFPAQIQAFQAGLRSMMTAPLISGDAVIGVLHFLSKKPKAYTEQDLRLAESIAAQIAGAIANARLFIARKRAEEEIRHFPRRLIGAIEEERKRIARDLHDECGQTLTVLHLGLEGLKQSLTGELPEWEAKLDEYIRLTERVGDKIRNISFDLRPDTLDDLGLIPTLEWYIKDIAQRMPETRINFQTMGFKKRLDAETEIVLYRIIQEALTNIVKHAQARHVDVRLTLSHPQVILMMKDDGVGFDEKEGMRPVGVKKPGIGLMGMRERAASVGGTMNIRSEKGKGTLIRVELPIHGSKADAKN